MKKQPSVTTVFLDVGGVLLTNGWDRRSRLLASQTFDFEHDEMESRHHLLFDTFEIGKLTLEQYLDKVVFYRKRQFTRDDFKTFMFEQSKPFPKMIEWASSLKVHGLKVAIINNESKELNDYRIKTFKLGSIADFFISSCNVRLRKPDEEIFHLAMDIAQVPAEQALFIDNTPMYIEIAEQLGIKSILHTDYESTCSKFSTFLANNDLKKMCCR